MLLPDLYYANVLAIDLAMLAQKGVDTLLVDLDNTIVPRDTNEITPAHRDWAVSLIDAGFRVCLVSNNWHERVRRVADELGFALVSKAVKPMPFAFLRALKKVGSNRRSAAVVGDQVFTDVLGGNLLGMTTVLVMPLSRSDLPHTLLLRRIESALLAGREPLA